MTTDQFMYVLALLILAVILIVMNLNASKMVKLLTFLLLWADLGYILYIFITIALAGAKN